MNGYWERKGAEQAKYDEMQDYGWEYTKKSESVFHSYYRYFNDGDLPGWARSRWDLTKPGRWGRELNQKGLEELERRTNEAVLAEYKRYQKALA